MIINNYEYTGRLRTWVLSRDVELKLDLFVWGTA